MLDEPTPRVNHEVPTTIRDGDGIRVLTWQWARGDNSTGPFTDTAGATARSYTPTDPNLGKFMKVTASYKDSNVRDEFLEITPVKALTVVSDDRVSLYTRRFATLLHIPSGVGQ